MLSIHNLINELSKRARYYTGLLNGLGLTVEYDEVYGEISLAAAQALKQYAKRGNHTACFKTVLNGFIRIQMADYKRTLEQIRQRFKPGDMEIEAAIEDGNGVGLIIDEINQQLNRSEKMTFNYMLHGGQRPCTYNTHKKAVRKIRTVAKGVIGYGTR